jgi:hypothetical protein
MAKLAAPIVTALVEVIGLAVAVPPRTRYGERSPV